MSHRVATSWGCVHGSFPSYSDRLLHLCPDFLPCAIFFLLELEAFLQRLLLLAAEEPQLFLLYWNCWVNKVSAVKLLWCWLHWCQRWGCWARTEAAADLILVPGWAGSAAFWPTGNPIWMTGGWIKGSKNSYKFLEDESMFKLQWCIIGFILPGNPCCWCWHTHSLGISHPK